MRTFERSAGDSEMVANLVEAFVIDPRSPQMLKRNYEFIRKLKRAPGQSYRNMPITLPNGLVLSIQCSKKYKCSPFEDLDDPGAYDSYEVAVSVAGRKMLDYLRVPGFENLASSASSDMNIMHNVPAATVEKLYQMAKTLTQPHIEAMIRDATQRREQWRGQQEAEEEEMEKLYGKAATWIDDIANALESKGLLAEAEQLDIIANTIDAAVEDFTLKAGDPRRSRINRILSEVSKEYTQSIPLDKIFKALEDNGLVAIAEDGTEWEGLLTGKEGRANIDVAFLGEAPKDGMRTPINNAKLVVSWYKMPSGKYETTTYLG